MVIVDGVVRFLTIIIYIMRDSYWLWAERKAGIAKPILRKTTLRGVLERWMYRSMWIFQLLQLLGLSVFPFHQNVVIQILGFMLVIFGSWIGVSARREIGTSWTHAVDYQIKKNHTLITTGIYRFIRHPIYAGLLLSYIGGELVVGSYLAGFFFVVGLLGAYLAGKREEKILLAHFGKKYDAYMSKTKMLIPAIL